MKSILFIESPLQLLNAYEAIEKFSIQDYVIIVRFSKNLQNDEQISYLIDKFTIQNIKPITIGASQKNLLDYFKLLYYKYFYQIPSDVDKVFIGNYDSGFLKLIMKKVPTDKIVLLDDGAKSIDIQAKFTDKFHYDLFTMYDFKPLYNQSIIKNNFQRLQKNLSDLELNKEEVLFLGLKLSEIGIVTQSYYLDQIIKITSYYKNKQIIYIAHRGEDKTKLQKIDELDNVQVVQLDYPVELYGLYHTKIPYKVASFYSTALLTMKNIYGMEAEGFLFNYTDSKYKKAIDNVYTYYEKYFKVHNLNA